MLLDNYSFQNFTFDVEARRFKNRISLKFRNEFNKKPTGCDTKWLTFNLIFPSLFTFYKLQAGGYGLTKIITSEHGRFSHKKL